LFRTHKQPSPPTHLPPPLAGDSLKLQVEKERKKERTKRKRDHKGTIHRPSTPSLTVSCFNFVSLDLLYRLHVAGFSSDVLASFLCDLCILLCSKFRWID